MQKVGWQFCCHQHGTVLPDVIERVWYRCCFKEQNIKLLENSIQKYILQINGLIATYSILELHVSESMASEAATQRTDLAILAKLCSLFCLPRAFSI